MMSSAITIQTFLLQRRTCYAEVREVFKLWIVQTLHITQTAVYGIATFTGRA